MFQPLYVAATGLNVFEEEMISITNNLSNAKTVAFKTGRTEKETLFYITKPFPQVLSEVLEKRNLEYPPEEIEFGTGVRIAGTPRDFTQGNLEVTKNPLDIAIQGEGFFQFKMADGTLAYSRAGNLHVDAEGNLVDPNGHVLYPQISLPDGTTSVFIKADGTIYVSINNSLTQQEIGQITLTKFVNPGGLKSLGQNLYAATEAAGEGYVGNPADTGFGSLSQYSLESSNVDVISEMMRMIMAQRVFDTVTKAVQSYQAMLTSVERMKQ